MAIAEPTSPVRVLAHPAVLPLLSARHDPAAAAGTCAHREALVLCNDPRSTGDAPTSLDGIALPAAAWGRRKKDSRDTV
jgi:hypothetical protein